MSKFAFVIEITASGDAKGTAFKKEDGQKAKDLFNKLRDEGKEAYYYQHPSHDKRCKSETQMTASKGTEGTSQASTVQTPPVESASMFKGPVSLDGDMEIIPSPSKKKNSIGGL